MRGAPEAARCSMVGPADPPRCQLSRRRAVLVTGLLVLALGLVRPGIGETQATWTGEETLVPIQTESGSLAPSPRTFGVSSSVAYTIPAWAFQAKDGSQIKSAGGFKRFHPVGEELEASVQLPAGALVTSFELVGCDTSNTDALSFIFVRVNNDGSYVPLSPLGTTGATPGCGVFPQALTTPHTIDNLHNTYYVALSGAGPTLATTVTAVRVFYRLQVSAAPVTATFGDVPPGHPFFQFIEALVKSGITVGCGGGNYCPDNPVTRGEMAVFLSKGLGLHFAP